MPGGRTEEIERYLDPACQRSAGEKSRTHCASAKIDLTPYAESLVIFSIRARAREVSRPRNYYNGVKFMLHFTDENNREQWKNAVRIDGTFDWKEISFYAMIGRPGNQSTLKLGLQESSGEVEFDLNSLRVVKLFTAPQEKYTARYSDAVRNTPPLRGVMSPVRFKAEDFATLRDWNVNLVRAQLVRNWGRPAPTAILRNTMRGSMTCSTIMKRCSRSAGKTVSASSSICIRFPAAATINEN
ncbi:MAG: hypothetical protein L6W00_22145 [Lentisphaeria bacterium]|nr:MAG: hypothetical protein L6W00_22145 [Lentisphaeria bacterium]